MQIPLKKVTVYTEKSKHGKYYYVLVFKLQGEKSFNITMSALWINSREATLFIPDAWDLKVWDRQKGEFLSEGNTALFIDLLKKGDWDNFLDVELFTKPEAESQTPKEENPFGLPMTKS